MDAPRRWFPADRWQMLAAIASGLAFSSVYGLEPLWWLAWIAPVPLLYVLLRPTATPALGRALGGLAALLAFAPQLAQASRVFGPFTALFFYLLQTALWAAVYGFLVRLHQRHSRWTNVFLYPLLWIAFECLTANISANGTWGSLAYSQMDVPLFLQGASLAGIAGVTVLPLLFASTAAFLLLRRQNPTWPRATVRLPLFLLLFALGASGWRLYFGQPGPMVRVGLASADRFLPANATAEAANLVHGKYADSIRQLASEGAWLVALPEKIATYDDARASQAAGAWQNLALETGVHLIVGADVQYTSHRHNVDWVFHPDGAAPQIYSKHHLVPGLESAFTPGHSLTSFIDGGARVGLQVCKDMDFPALSRAYGRMGVNMIVAPAWDFGSDGQYHSRMAILRGIESGFTVIRVGRNGRLTVSDRYGRLTAESPSQDFPPVQLLAWAPVPVPELTLYAAIGDSLGWLALFLVILLRFLPAKPAPAVAR